MAAGDGVLFVDVDGDDSISTLAEYVFTEWDRTASDDMEGLARVFDTSGDGRLSAADARWVDFRVMVTKLYRGEMDVWVNGTDSQGGVIKSLSTTPEHPFLTLDSNFASIWQVIGTGNRCMA